MNIEKLAKQVGYPIRHEEWRKATEEFAALVEEAARADEREACAKVCEDTYDLFVREKPSRASALDAATAIRARGTT